MDLRTSAILKHIDLYVKIRKYLTFLCYFLIVAGIFIYIFYAINKANQKYKIVSDFQKNPQKFETEKIMVNPRIKFQYNDNEIYEIKAQRASHHNDEEVTLFNVYATSKTGNITAGKLEVSEEGDHLIFTQNPILILNKTKNDK